MVIRGIFYYYPTTALGRGSSILDHYYKGSALCCGNCLVIRQPVSPNTENLLFAEPLRTVQGMPKEIHSAS